MMFPCDLQATWANSFSSVTEWVWTSDDY